MSNFEPGQTLSFADIMAMRSAKLAEDAQPEKPKRSKRSDKAED